MDRKVSLLALALVAGLAATASAQDSTSKDSGGSGLPGDALNWNSSTAQRTRYVVESQRLTTSWGVKFGIVPLVKTDSPVNANLGQTTTFFNNLAGSFGMSRTQRTTNFRGTSYTYWQAPTAGINPTANDQSLNLPSLTPTGTSYQFSAFVNQFGAATGGSTVNSGIGAVVNYAPDNIRRFYVERSLVAASSPDGAANNNNGSTSIGASDSNGLFTLRADNNGGNSAAAQRVQGQNILRVNLLNRSNAVNTLSGSGTSTVASDAAATFFAANGFPAGTTLSIPSMLPASLAQGGNARYLGPDFGKAYDYEATVGSITTLPPATSYLATVSSVSGQPIGATYPDHRGAICVYPGSLFGGTSVATAAVLARSGTNGPNNDYISIWGLNNDASMTAGKIYALAVPNSVTLNRAPASDNSPIGPSIFQTTPNTPATMSGDLAGHQGATAFQGGNSQVAIGKDLAGRGLVAGLYYENFSIPSSDVTPTPNNAIIVGRFDPANPQGTIQWTTVAWTYAAGSTVADCDGTPIRGDWGTNGHSSSAVASPGQFDGVVNLNSSSSTYDRPIGRLQPALSFPSGGSPTVIGSPSLSMPAFDSVGNIWFTARVAAINTYSTTTSSSFSRYNSCLIRAVYNPDTFTYDLELVAEFGDRILGKNSLTKYSIGGFVFAASNQATSPSTFFSSSVAPYADRNLNIGNAISNGDITTWGANGAVVDPRSLGGLVLGGNFLYDINGDNQYQDPSGASPSNPNSPDEQYSGIFFINFRSCDSDFNGDGIVDDSDFVIFVNAYNNLLDTFGDLNFDNITDDSDFVIFANDYNEFFCTLQPGS
ncbi:MAG: hypothetical protein U0573_06700 [Phycisphaerales bacterium]|nr:hypothetical protein [Planctomycetota bacterium]